MLKRCGICFAPALAAITKCLGMSPHELKYLFPEPERFQSALTCELSMKVLNAAGKHSLRLAPVAVSRTAQSMQMNGLLAETFGGYAADSDVWLELRDDVRIKNGTGAGGLKPGLYEKLRELCMPILLADGVIHEHAGGGYMDCQGQPFVFPERKGTGTSGATKGMRRTDLLQ